MGAGKMWTPEEISILRAMYDKHGGAIDEWEWLIPNRSENAIRVQARRMGLTHVKSHTGMSTSQRKRVLRGFQALCGQLHVNPKTALIELNRMREQGMV
jgi:hypothetical protein